MAVVIWCYGMQRANSNLIQVVQDPILHAPNRIWLALLQQAMLHVLHVFESQPCPVSGIMLIHHLPINIPVAMRVLATPKSFTWCMATD